MHAELVKPIQEKCFRRFPGINTPGCARAVGPLTSPYKPTTLVDLLSEIPAKKRRTCPRILEVQREAGLEGRCHRGIHRCALESELLTQRLLVAEIRETEQRVQCRGDGNAVRNRQSPLIFDGN
jgi:hypothetical protein